MPEQICPICQKPMSEDHRECLARAVFMARVAYDFIQEGCYGDEVEGVDEDSPDYELWLKRHAVSDAIDQNPWVRQAP